MKTQIKLVTICHLLFGICLSAHAQGTTFTYQGRLNDGSNPANGTYDLRFAIYDAPTAGTQQGTLLTNSASAISNGLFTVALDFGPIFTGANYWLDIGVRTNGNGVFSELVPRQALTPAPYAIMANSASNLLGALPAAQLSAGTASINISGSAATVTGSFAGDVTGTQNATVASKVGGVTAANVAAGANAANAATSAATADTIVKRDNGGNFSVGGLTLVSNLYLPDPTASAGIIYLGTNTLMHGFGIDNFFAGVNAGNFTLTGELNVGIGNLALAKDTYGDENTAIGSFALSSNTNGNYNTAIGSYALFSNTSGHDNMAAGLEALSSNTNGSYNIAIGSMTLFHNASGAGNIAIGSYALVGNTGGNDNIAIGGDALAFNTTGHDNTAVGEAALEGNATGFDNIAIGVGAIFSNTTGDWNTAIGMDALNFNSTGNNNTAIGFQALYHNNSGTANTANGAGALYLVSSGSGNIGVGQGSLPNLTNGSGNIAIGVSAGSAIVTGNNNIDIGNSGFGDETGVIRIGTVGTHTKAVMNGIFGTTVGGGAAVQVNANGLLGTVTSSARFKKNIQSMDAASDVLLALKPVTFQYKPDLDPEGTPQFGLIAEDVEKVDPALVLHDDKNQIYTVRYEAVNAMLLNEFLKEHHRVAEQNMEIQNLKQSVAELKQIVQSLGEKK